MTVGERIASMRLSQGLSQTALAKLSNVSQQAISTIESGKRIPNSSTLRLLAAALNTTVSALMGETPAPIEASAIQKETPGSLSAFENRLLSAFRLADPTYQSVALELLESHPLPASKTNRA